MTEAVRSGFVVWFTGLSGSGKSTLAAMLAAELTRRGVHVEALDGDEVRLHLSKGLGFSKEDRDVNVRRIGFVAKLIARSGACAITAAISPYREIRDEQRRASLGRFCEVYCSCPVNALAERDPKGLYKKALAGEIKNFTGVDDPYEAPDSPEVVVETDKETKEVSLAKIVAKLAELGFIEPSASGPDVRLGGAGMGASTKAAARSPEPQLVAPHGGELVDRFAHGSEKDRLAEKAAGLFSLTIDARAEADIENLATGAFSPLKGFMTSKDYLRVVREMRLENGLVWPAPVTLAISEDEASRVEVGTEVALSLRDGRRVAILEVSDKYRPHKENEAKSVYLTTDEKHPGIRYLKASGDVYVGGEIRVLSLPRPPEFPAHHRDPRETREIFVARGWTRVVGFQTRNPMHRAHEYVTKCALEICDGLLVHPLVGETKDDDVPAAVRMRCYEALLARYYPQDRVLLSVYPAAMRYGGPREALFHALARKNYGCSHFIVGRDHAGVGDTYGKADAQHLFDQLAPAEVGVIALPFEEAFYSRAAQGMATVKTAPVSLDAAASSDTGVEPRISGTEIRALLRAGKAPGPELMRPEVAAILLDSMKAG